MALMPPKSGTHRDLALRRKLRQTPIPNAHSEKLLKRQGSPDFPSPGTGHRGSTKPIAKGQRITVCRACSKGGQMDAETRLCRRTSCKLSRARRLARHEAKRERRER